MIAAGLFVAEGSHLARDEISQDTVEQGGVGSGHLHIGDGSVASHPELSIGVD